MSKQEKRAWIQAVCATVAYATYLVLVLSQAGGRELSTIPYAIPMLATIGGSILAAILLDIFVGGRPERRDQRDREISRFGDYTGQAFVVIGALGALLLAVGGFEQFWIANLIYLCFVLSAVLGSLARISAYRTGMPAQW